MGWGREIKTTAEAYGLLPNDPGLQIGSEGGHGGGIQGLCGKCSPETDCGGIE